MATIPSPPADAPTAPPPPARHHADAPLAIGLSIVASLIGLIVLAWAVLFLTKGRFLKPRFERIASSLLQRQVKVAGDFQLYFDPINIRFVADGLTVSNPAWASRPFFLDARHVDTRISTVRLIFGERHARWLNLIDAAVDTEWDKAHLHNTWTFGDPAKKGAPFQFPVIDHASARGTTLRFRDPRMLLATDVRFDPIRSRATSIADAIGLAGTGTLRGYPFVMNGQILSPNSTVRLGRTQIELHATSGATKLDVAGVLPAATQIEGSDLTMRVRGPNLRTLFDFLGAAVPDTRAYEFRSKLTKVGGEWRFTRLAGHFGDSDLGGRMTISLPDDRLKIVATLASQKVDIIDIGPLVGYDPQILATKGATAAATTQGKPGDVRILPDAPLRAASLKVFDAHVDYHVQTIRAPHLPVSNLTTTVDLDHDLLAISPLSMDVAGGHLDADIGLNAREPQVATDYDIRLSPTPLGKLLGGFGVAGAGTTGTVKARIQMRGIGDSLRKSLATSNGRIAIVLPAGAFTMQNVQLAEFDVGVFLQRLFQDKLKKPVHINCGLIGFTVRDGVAAADPILIDTDANVMAAKGGFDFADESLNLMFRADAKKFSIFSGQSPVGIGGHFAAPKLQIVTPQLLARGGAAVALGVVGTPVAALLAFVDPGDAKSAACGPVLAGATAAQQHSTKGDPIKALGTKAQNGTDATKPVKKKKFLGIF